VRSLCTDGRLDLLPWTGASLLAQAWLGAGVCKVFGFSYEALRVVTLVLSLGGIVATFALLRVVGAGARVAAAGAAVVAFSPPWMNLSLTFMTDVPFAALATIAAALYARGLGSGRAFDVSAGGVEGGDDHGAFVESAGGAVLQGEPAGSRRLPLLLAASVMAAAAFLVRQHGIFLALGAAGAVLLAGRARGRARETSPASSWRRVMIEAAAAAGIPVVVAAAYVAWTVVGDAAPQALHNKVSDAVTTSWWRVGDAAYRGVVTTGLLLLPWALMLGRPAVRETLVFAGLVVGLGACALFLFVRDGATMFYLPNVMHASGLGALTLRAAVFLALPVLPAAGPTVMIPVTVVAVLAAAALVARLLSSLPRADDAAGTFCLLTLALLALGTLGQSAYYFDRYLLPLLPLAMAAVVVASRGASQSASGRLAVRGTALGGRDAAAAAAPGNAAAPGARLAPSNASAAAWIVLALYAVAGTRDYMEWNRARWALLAGLEAGGIRAEAIDGGMEYNAERLAARLRSAPTHAEARPGQKASVKSWWWVVDDEWVVAFAPLDGYRPVAERRYRRLLPPGQGRVVLQRRHAAGGDTGADER
jgi:hypothetical protein